MSSPLRILLPLLLIGASLLIGKRLIATAPESERTPPKQAVPLVEVVELQAVDYPVTLRSRGTIAAQTQSELVAEVAGRITATSPQFKPGGQFAEGEALVPSDYHHAVTIAEADLAQARLNLEKSRAEASQAEANWQQMKLSTRPTALTLHRPQLAQAEAALSAAEAKLSKAQRDLHRTRLLAPYGGRLLEQRAAVGQFVTRGAALATLYATDIAEVRLPITDRQARFLTLPESGHQAIVTLQGHDTTQQWEGRLVRSEAAIDSRTQQLYVVAQIKNPFSAATEGADTLRIGQFVRATIAGKTLRQVFEVPRVAVRNGNEVLIVDADNRIRRRQLEVVWQQTGQLLASSGLHSGDRVITTALPYAPDGMVVKIAP